MKKINIKGVIVPNDDKWIYDLFEMESTSPGEVNELVEKANGEDLEVIINSPGGDVYSGSEIYTTIKDYESKAKVVSKIVGIAASAASVIAMAGKTLISPTAQIMIHNASAVARGDHRDLTDGSEFLKGWDKSIASAYELKTGMSKEDLLSLMGEETWMGADEAKEKGFVDEIMFENKPKLVASAKEAKIIPQQVIDKVRNDFVKSDNIKGKYARKTMNDHLKNKEKIKNEQEDESMDLEKIKNEHPDLYNQIKEEGYKEGVKAENDRFKDIEDLAVPGHDELVNNAKFKTMDTAEKLAMNIVKAQKEKGSQFLTNRAVDAKDLDEVEGSDAGDANGEINDQEKAKNLFEKVAKGGKQ